MGGAWERQIRTVRSVLSALLYDHGRQLEWLQTLMVEAKSIVTVGCLPPMKRHVRRRLIH